MKVSEITNKFIADYLRIDFDSASHDEILALDTFINSSIKFISNYTGLTIEEMDQHEEISHVVFILCQDMHDNRSYYVDKNNINHVVESILGMHSKNLL